MFDPFRRRPLAKVRVSRRAPRDEESSGPEPLDPVALAIAVWLGLIAGTTGLIRLSENQANTAAIARAAGTTRPTPEIAGYYTNFGS